MNAKRILTIVTAAAALTAAASLVGTALKSPTLSDSPLKGDIYVRMVNNGDWELSNPLRGIYLLNPSDGTTEAKIQNNNFTQGQASVVANGLLYISNISASGSSWAYAGDLTVYDLETGLPTARVEYPAQNWENRCTAYAYNKATDEIWACVNGKEGATNGKEFYLAKFNPATYKYTTVKQLSTGYSAMAVDIDNNLYGTIGGTADIVRIEDDGSYSILATAPETPKTGTPVALTYSPADNCLIYIYQNAAEQTKLATITTDPYNARYSDICTLEGRPWISSVYATGSWAAENAPSEISDLAVVYESEGSCDASLSFTVPQKAINGENLTGTYSATIIIDDAEPLTIGTSYSPSDKVTYSFTLSEGNHSIKVRLLGNDGASDGETAVVNTFAGFDTPTAVKNLKYKKNSTGGFTLTWEAPVGQHGAPIGKPVYHIVVNDKDDYTTTGTQWTDNEIAPEMATYSYSVYAEAEGKQGPAVGTGKVVLGTALEVPYATDFSSPAGVDFFTIINANGDINASNGTDITWTYDSRNKIFNYHRPGSGMDPDGGDDYLVLPALSMKAGFVYSLQVDMKIGSTKPEVLEILVSQGAFPDDVKVAKVISEATEYTNRNYELKEFYFIPEQDGDYNFSIHYLTPTANSIDVSIDKINVVSIGSAQAPAAPTDLQVIPEGSGSLNATVMFKTPTTDFNGNEISKLSAVTIYRDGEEIYTAGGYKPGQLVSYEDEVPSTDFYTYSVTASNEYGPGKDAALNICVGALLPPVNLDFSSEEGCGQATIEDVTTTDNQTFYFDQEKGGLAYMPQATGQVLDYFHTKYIYLRKGQIINLTMEYSAYNSDDKQDMSFAFCVKTATQKQTLYPWLVIRKDESHAIGQCSFTVNNDGLYCFGAGFENYVNPNHTGIVVHKFDVTSEVAPEAPAAVNFREATAAAGGKLEASVEFIMPTKTAGGEDLDPDAEITATIFNSLNEKVGEATGKPNAQITTDFTTIQGEHYYSIITSNDKGQGKTTIFGLFSGVDKPMRVTNIQALPSDEDNMSAEISWDAPVDAEHRGAWFNPDELGYIVTVTDEDGKEIKKFDTDKRYVIFETEETALGRYDFAVVPYTNAGVGSQPLLASLYLGQPLSLPFAESFDGELTTGPWQFGGWYVGSKAPYGSSLIFGGYRGTATLPKLTFFGLSEVQLSYDLYHYEGSVGVVSIQVSGDDINWITIPTSSIHTGTFADGVAGTYGWQNDVTLDLSGYRSYNWISIRFLGEGSEFAVRNIRIADTESAVNEINCDNESAGKYYNLQGIPVANPAKGEIYILQQGNTSRKVVY